MNNLKLITITFSALVLTSCERAFIPDDEPNNPVSVFNYLWNKVDQQYAFFDIKGVDWDSVYEVYRPKVHDEMDKDSLFRVCAAMLNTLRDGHTNLISGFDVSRNDSVYYKMYAEKNIDPDVVTLNYLTINYHTTGGFMHNAIRNGEVAYINYSSFTNDVTESSLSYLLNRYKDCKGLILDLRQNGGGSIDNIGKLLSILDNHGQPLYQTQIKSGPGHDEFSSSTTVYADEVSIDPYTKPVAVLIDRGSYSATSFFALCTMAYDNIKLFGDYTGGGLGLPNGGALPNGWTYRFSITRTLDMSGNNYENGVPPDVRVILDPACTAQGIDNVIEAAADWIMQ
ncbi:MAG: S41 family peptidase [Bacteroidales bacterium]|nr:S41 family peptidase [Bacteroidales bacterium]